MRGILYTCKIWQNRLLERKFDTFRKRKVKSYHRKSLREPLQWFPSVSGVAGSLRPICPVHWRTWLVFKVPGINPVHIISRGIDFIEEMGKPQNIRSRGWGEFAKSINQPSIASIKRTVTLGIPCIHSLIHSMLEHHASWFVKDSKVNCNARGPVHV